MKNNLGDLRPKLAIQKDFVQLQANGVNISCP